MNWCMIGGEIIDFYVTPTLRGRGGALLLAASVAAEIQKRGGTFMKGGAANDTVRSFFERIANCPPNGECHVSGRAFRHVAGFAGRGIRDIVRDLPEKSWHFEA